MVSFRGFPNWMVPSACSCFSMLVGFIDFARSEKLVKSRIQKRVTWWACVLTHVCGRGILQLQSTCIFRCVYFAYWRGDRSRCVKVRETESCGISRSAPKTPMQHLTNTNLSLKCSTACSLRWCLREGGVQVNFKFEKDYEKFKERRARNARCTYKCKLKTHKTHKKGEESFYPFPFQSLSRTKNVHTTMRKIAFAHRNTAKYTHKRAHYLWVWKLQW